MDNPNAPDKDGVTPIHWAAREGYTEIVKILARLTHNPKNSPNIFGVTPIHWAASEGNTEIVKILAHLTDNPNAPDNLGNTPSSYTKNEDIQRILKIEKNVSRCYPSRKRSKKF